MVRRHRGRRHDHFSAVCLEQPHLLLGHLVGHGEDATVALERGRHGQPDTGIAAGALDYGAAGLELSRSLGGLDDGEADAVLHRTTGIGVLGLAVHRGADAGPDSRKPDQRGPADGVEDVVVGTGMRGCHGLSGTAGFRKCTGWMNEALTGDPRLSAGANLSPEAPATAAESSAG